MTTNNITYETLFDLLRRERNREELQKLEPSFYHDVLAYMAQKQQLLDKFSGEDRLFASAEAEKARIQFHNIKKIIKELYDRREKKIVMLSVNAVRTGSELADKSVFLEQERLLYGDLTDQFRRYREEVLHTVLRQAAPYGASNPQQSASNHQQSADTPQPSASSKAPSNDKPKATPRTVPEPASVETDTLATTAQAAPKNPEGTKIRFLKAIPRFAGATGDTYGPYSAGDEADLPEKIAAILLKKGRAETL